MELTARIKNLSDKFSLDPEDIAFADLIHSGWGRAEAAYCAYHLAYFDNSKITTWLRDRTKLRPGISGMIAYLEEEDKKKKEKLKELEQKLSNKQKRLERDAENLKSSAEEALRSKSGMLDALIDLSSTPGIDIKTKSDLLKQITDLQQYKKEEIKELDNRIFFFLPLTCAKCSLYLANKNKKNNNTNQENNEPTEDLQQ